MPVGRRCRFLMLLLPLFATGCGPLFGLPTVWPPESQKTQVARASKFDPFPDPNMGPAVIGGRPQGFLNPRPEPDPNKTGRSDWFNPSPGPAIRRRCIIRGRCGLSTTADDNLHLSLDRCGRSTAGRLFFASSSANGAGRYFDATRRDRCPDCLRQEDRFPLTAGFGRAMMRCPRARRIPRRLRSNFSSDQPCPKLASSRTAVGARAARCRNRTQRRGVTSRSAALCARRMTPAWCDCKKCWPRRESAAGGSARKSSARGVLMSTAKWFRNWARGSIRFSTKFESTAKPCRAQAAALFSDQQADGHFVDQSGSFRPAARDRFGPSRERLFTVGRLDKTSEGLILATNDGQLTDLLTHPRYGVEKTYWALVAGSVSPEAASKLERGVHLAEGFAHAKRVTVRRAHQQSTILEIVLDEGRNREVRRLLARIGHKVLKLRRIAIGPLRLGNMKPGENRPLLRDEVEALYEAAASGGGNRTRGLKTDDTPKNCRRFAGFGCIR